MWTEFNWSFPYYRHEKFRNLEKKVLDHEVTINELIKVIDKYKTYVDKLIESNKEPKPERVPKIKVKIRKTKIK